MLVAGYSLVSFFFFLLSCKAPYLSMYNYLSQVGESKIPGGKDGRAMIVVDCGYSFSHVVPYFDSQVINYGVKR